MMKVDTESYKRKGDNEYDINPSAIKRSKVITSGPCLGVPQRETIQATPAVHTERSEAAMVMNTSAHGPSVNITTLPVSGGPPGISQMVPTSQIPRALLSAPSSTVGNTALPALGGPSGALQTGPTCQIAPAVTSAPVSAIQSTTLPISVGLRGVSQTDSATHANKPHPRARKSRATKLRDRIEIAELTVLLKDREISDLTIHNNKLRTKLSRRTGTSKDAKGKFTTRIAKLEEDIAKLTKDVEDGKKQNAVLEAERDVLLVKHRLEESKTEELLQEVGRQKAEAERIVSENLKLQRSFLDAETSNTDIRSKNDQLKQKIAELEGDPKRLDLASLRDHADGLRAHNVQLKAELRRKCKQLEERERQPLASHRVPSNSGPSLGLQRELRLAKSQLDDVRSSNAKAVEGLEDELRKVKLELEDGERSRAEALEASRADRDATLALQAMNSKLQSQLEQLERVQKARDEEHFGEITSIKHEFDERGSAINALARQLTEAKSSNDKLSSDNDRTTKEFRDLLDDPVIRDRLVIIRPEDHVGLVKMEALA